MGKVIILGAGMIGGAMAADMMKRHEVTVADIDEQALGQLHEKHEALRTEVLDVTDTGHLHKVIRDFELVICAVPGFLGFETLRSVIEQGKNVVDISFFPENAFGLNELAQDRGVTAIVDCGVAPGLGNLILGHYNEKFKITNFECLVGGLPKTRQWPSYYKAPFSPVDVIEEYTRPARYVQNGQLVIKDALSDCEFVEFDRIGTLECFNTDGLRSLIYTMPDIPNMRERTLRYPGHVDFVKSLKHAGFFDSEPVEAGANVFVPREVTSEILFRTWKLQDDEEEVTVMRVTMDGEDDHGKKKRVSFELYDEYNSETKTSSMARTTGYTATAVANLVLDGVFNAKGIFPPELIGKFPPCFNYVINYLKERKIELRQI